MTNMMRVVQYGCEIQYADDGQTRVKLIRMVDYGKELGKPAETHVIEFASLEDAERILSAARIKVWHALQADPPIPSTPHDAVKFLDHAHGFLLNSDRRIGISPGEVLNHPDYDAMEILNNLATQITREN